MESRLKIIKAITNMIFLEDEPVKSDIIIVPGSSQMEIVKKAVELYKLEVSNKIIFTGSFNEKIQEYESEYGREYALKQGVKKGDIYIEKKSTNTKENAIYSRKIIIKHDLKSKRILIPCKSYHSMRIKMSFLSEFPKSIISTIPTVDSRNITRNNWWKSGEKTEIVMGEVEKIGQYFLKGDIVIQ